MHKIELRRIELGFSVADVAVLSGLSAQTIYRLEREDPDDYKVRMDTAKLIAYALDVPLITLFGSKEISFLGRPALSGGTIDELAKRRQAKAELKCPECNVLSSQKDRLDDNKVSECCNKVLITA